MTHSEVDKQISDLLAEYDFPLTVLQDVTGRLQGTEDPYYAAQQLKYLKNIVHAGCVQKK